jgi:hypothetical protein
MRIVVFGNYHYRDVHAPKGPEIKSLMSDLLFSLRWMFLSMEYRTVVG